LWRAARAYVLLDSKGLMEPFDLNHIVEVAGNDPELGTIKGAELFDAWKLRLHDTLIRHYRPDYAALPDEERIGLLAQTAKRVDAMLSATRELQNCLEIGDATGLPRQRPRTDHYKGAAPQRDIRAAELSDALGLKHLEIATVLGLPVPNDYRANKENLHGGTYKIPAVIAAIERGRNLLKQALLSEEEYKNYMQLISPKVKDRYAYERMLLAAARDHSQ
jgi:hypothetical protein